MDPITRAACDWAGGIAIGGSCIDPSKTILPVVFVVLIGLAVIVALRIIVRSVRPSPRLVCPQCGHPLQTRDQVQIAGTLLHQRCVAAWRSTDRDRGPAATGA